MDDLRRLTQVSEALTANGVRWWVDHGTLLGLVREQRILPWDQDIDLSVQDQDLDRCHLALREIAPFLGTRQIRTRRNLKLAPYTSAGQRAIDIGAYITLPDGALTKRLIMFPRGSAHRLPRMRRFVWRRARTAENLLNRLDHSQLRRDPTGASTRRRALGRMLQLLVATRESVGVAKESQVPPDYFSRLGAIKWRGLHLPIPQHSEDYLEFRYGPDWRTPRRKWRWWSDDRTI